MTYGYQPRNWPDLARRLAAEGIAVGDIEKMEIRPAPEAGGATMVDIVVTLRSGRVHAWRQPEDLSQRFS
jgi:hypothetical protein